MIYSRIYVTNFAGHDLSDAFKFTRLSKEKAQVDITEGNVDIFDLERVIFVIKQKLKQSRRGDYLLFCGSILLAAVAFSIWLEKHKEVKLLLYNAKEKRYFLKRIKLSQIIERF